MNLLMKGKDTGKTQIEINMVIKKPRRNRQNQALSDSAITMKIVDQVINVRIRTKRYTGSNRTC